MRRAIVRVGAAAMVATAGLAVSPATSSAEPDGQLVRYTLTVTGASDFEVNYLVSQPASKEAYNADPYAYLKKERLNVAPGVPWVFETTLADPQWAIITASTGVHAMVAPPAPSCEITIDGQVAAQQGAPYTAQCQLSQW